MIKKNKILFIVDNFPPEVNAPARRSYEHIQEWVKHGKEVTVITSFPNFPKGKIFDGYKNKFYKKEILNGIIIYRVWTYISENKGFLRRILDYMSFGFMSFIIGLFIKTDLIIATSPQFFSAISGNFLSFFKRKPWIFEVRDIWPESIKAVGSLQNGFIYKFLEWVEIKLYKSSEKIIVVTDSFKENIIKKGIVGSKIFVHKNGYLSDNIILNSSKNLKLRNKLNLKNKFIIAYIGTLGLAHSLSFVLRCLPSIYNKNNKIHFLIIGDGAEKKNLLDLKNKLKLKNITFLPIMNQNKVSKYLSLMDASLVNLKKSNTFKSVIPSKIFEAAAYNKPIILGVEGESKKIISKFNAGICFEPENKNEFINSCLNISVKKKYKSFDSGLKNLREKFDRKKIAISMLNDILN
tara:strand:+ start:25108 stop:26328 length:1221 start_codon:yes stop_codon:yes gene_type:complete